MSNAVARRAVNGSVIIPATLPIPPMPAKVATHLRDLRAFAEARSMWQRAHPDSREEGFVGMAPRMLALITPERAEAEIAMVEIEREAEGIALEVFRSWIGPVNGAVRNPQGQADFEIRALALHEMLSDLPAGCFTSEARRSLPAFFPSAADIRAAVEPGAAQIRMTRDVLVRTLNKPQTRSEPEGGAYQPATAAEIEAVKAKVRAFVAETQHAPERSGPTSEGQARHLSDGALLAHFEAAAAQGNKAAALRAQFLRGKIEARR